LPSLISHAFRLVMQRGNFFGAPGIPLPEMRSRAEASTRWLPIPRHVAVQPVHAGGVPAEWVIPKGAPDDRVLLYAHGGAWVFCSPRTHRAMVAQLALAGGIKALSLDYRLAPEFPFPAALDDCMAAYRWLLHEGIDPHKIIIAGDSAGGNLILAMLLALRDAGDPLPSAAVGLSPAIDLAKSGKKTPNNTGKDPVLHRLQKSPLHLGYIGDHDPRDPLISPIYGDLHGLPPVLIHVGSDESLMDEVIRFVDCARQARVDAQVVVWRGMWHVFQIFGPLMPEARDSIQQIGKFIRERLSVSAR
jgi:epsilon-lactone hydrolase